MKTQCLQTNETQHYLGKEKLLKSRLYPQARQAAANGPRFLGAPESSKIFFFEIKYLKIYFAPQILRVFLQIQVFYTHRALTMILAQGPHSSKDGPDYWGCYAIMNSRSPYSRSNPPHVCLYSYTGGPRYMREIGTPKIGSHIMNWHIKRPKITVNQRIGSRKEAISGFYICKIADKKTTYNESCLYFFFSAKPKRYDH